MEIRLHPKVELSAKLRHDRGKNMGLGDSGETTPQLPADASEVERKQAELGERLIRD